MLLAAIVFHLFLLIYCSSLQVQKVFSVIIRTKNNSHFSLLTTINLYVEYNENFTAWVQFTGVNRLGCVGLVHRHTKCGKFVKAIHSLHIYKHC